MANLDTPSKRASGLQFMRPWWVAMPLADGVLGKGDRQHIARSYSGILAAGGVVIPPSPGGGGGSGGVGGYAYDYNVRTLVRHIERPRAPEFNLKELELIRAEWQANVRMLEQDIALIEEAALALLDY